MKKGEITFKILKFLGGGAVNSWDVFIAILNAGYGASYKKMEYELIKVRKLRERNEFQKQAEHRYQKLIYKLKKEGFIEKKTENRKKFLYLTQKGKEKLKTLSDFFKSRLPSAYYEAEKVKQIIIFTFDIPENERRKRDWLRNVLKNLSFKMIQKSVWIGKTKIPRELLDDLRDLKMIELVEIFEVGKTGSLKNIL